MDANRLALLFVICVNLYLGAFVYLKDRKNAVNISFSILAGSVVLWSSGNFMIVSVWRDSNPIFWVRITYALGTSMATCFAVFSVIFPDGRLQTIKRYLRYMIPAVAALTIISLSPLSIKEIIFENGVIVKTHYGIGNVLWALYVVACLAIAFHSLGSKWIKGSGIGKLRVQYMALGIVVTTSLIAFTNIFIPLVLGYESASGYGPCFTMIMVGCIAYAIVKHRLMNISTFIRKGIIYSILMAGATLVVTSLVIGVQYAFPRLDEEKSIIVSLLAVLFITFVLKPFSQNLKELINAFIFRNQHHVQRSLSNFAQSASRMLDMEKLLNLIFNTAMESIRVDRASLWILDAESGTYHAKLLLGLKGNELKINLSTESAVAHYLKIVRGPVIREELGRSLSLEDFDRIESDFRELKAEISLPLFANDQMVAILNLGDKASGRIYYEEDVNLLKALAEQSSIAIQNAGLHQQVVNMKNYSEAILENLTSGVIAIDLPSNKISTINQAGARILGIESDIAANTDASYLPEYMQDLLIRTPGTGSGFRDLEMTITAVDGKDEKTILINTTTLKNEKQETAGSIAVFSDTSILKAIEAEIRKTEKLSSLGRMAAELAHEIKNPLVTIKTFLQLLMEDEEELDKEYLELTISETDRINGLIRQLLDLTRREPPQFARCSINQILDEAILMLKRDMSGRNIELLDLRRDDLADIYADSDQLKQIFLNIGLNAIEAMENGGKLSIGTCMEPCSKQFMSSLRYGNQRSEENLSAHPEMDSVVVNISDTGKGIPKDALEKVFEPFYTTKTTGTGLGLPIVSNIVREHRGVITVDSQEQVGTTFRIELPSIEAKVIAVK